MSSRVPDEASSLDDQEAMIAYHLTLDNTPEELADLAAWAEEISVARAVLAAAANDPTKIISDEPVYEEHFPR